MNKIKTKIHDASHLYNYHDLQAKKNEERSLAKKKRGDQLTIMPIIPRSIETGFTKIFYENESSMIQIVVL